MPTVSVSQEQVDAVDDLVRSLTTGPYEGFAVLVAVQIKIHERFGGENIPLGDLADLIRKMIVTHRESPCQLQ
jgi:hypothetical protein